MTQISGWLLSIVSSRVVPERGNPIKNVRLDSSKVLVHSIVKIKNLTNSAVMEYKLVAQSEANLAQGKISVDSPIGKGLLGKETGDSVEIEIPSGNVKFEILEISR